MGTENTQPSYRAPETVNRSVRAERPAPSPSASRQAPQPKMERQEKVGRDRTR